MAFGFNSRSAGHRPTSDKSRGERSIAARRAFTVVELLVVIAVIAVVCALILPAVQRAREAARRVACKNNLHQLGVALNAYHDARQCLPSGWILETPVAGNSQNGWGWLAMLLPSMDQGPLFNSINFNHRVENASNETARLSVVTAFLCPSDHVPARVPFFRKGFGPSPSAASLQRAANTVSAGGIMFEVAGASYLGVFGTSDPDDRPDVRGDGVFAHNSAVRFADLIDGSSQTLIVGERSARRLAGTWTGMHPEEDEGPERIVGFAEHSPNHADADEAEFSSRHPCGVNFLFGDGSVRFLSDDMDRLVYQALCTRAGGETISRTEF